MFTRNALAGVDPSKTKVISFDTISPALDLLREGKVQVLLGQKYFGWGSESVKLLHDIKQGRMPPSPIIDSGVDIVTRRTSTRTQNSGKRWNPANSVSSGSLGYLLRLVAITGVYFVAGRVGLSFAFVNANASAIWPPTGIAVASLLLYGLHGWPAVFIGAFLVNLTTTGAIVPSTAIACGNTLEAVSAAWFIGRFAGGIRAFENAADIARAAAFALLVATPIAATVGTLTLQATNLAARDDLAVVWSTWWLGDAAGAVTVTPLVLLWTHRPWLAALAARPLEALLVAVTLIGVTLGVFGDYTVAGREHWELAWLCLPVLLWTALRFGPKECVAGATVVSLLAIRNTLEGSGPFSAHPPNHALLMLQCFISVLMLATLATAAEARERRAREQELQLLNRELEERVAARTADLARAQDHLQEAQHIARIGSWEWDILLDRVSWSDELYRIYGLEPSTFTASYDGFLERVHPDDVTVVQQQVTNAVSSGEEYDVRAPDRPAGRQPPRARRTCRRRSRCGRTSAAPHRHSAGHYRSAPRGGRARSARSGARRPRRG